MSCLSYAQEAALSLMNKTAVTQILITCTWKFSSLFTAAPKIIFEGYKDKSRGKESEKKFIVTGCKNQFIDKELLLKTMLR